MCISIWTPSHEHLTTTQFLVASPAFCRYSIYFFALRPTHPHHHHQHKYQRNKNKTLVAPPLVEPTIRHASPTSTPKSCPPATDARPPPDNTDTSPPHTPIFLTDMTNTQIGTARLGHRHYIKTTKNHAHLHWISISTEKTLVAPPAFCPYSIYFLHCAPPIPATIISTNTNTKK